MNTPLTPLPLSVSVPVPTKKRRVLLVDTSVHKRDLRAEVMRKLGMDVDCAADIAEARSWWKADFYDLVLINMEQGRGHRDRFCEDLRGATPPQRMAFLVGKPSYLADSPSSDEELLLPEADPQTTIADVKATLATDLGDLNQRWGILEASRRISAVRSACTARAQAIRERPAPARDSEARASKRTSGAATLDDLLREEMQ